MSREKTIGEKLSPVLVEIEDTLWEHEASIGSKPEYTMPGFRAGCKIFMSTLIDKMVDKQIREGKTQESAMKESAMLGSEIRTLILKYTGIDTYDFYESANKVN